MAVVSRNETSGLSDTDPILRNVPSNEHEHLSIDGSPEPDQHNTTDDNDEFVYPTSLDTVEQRTISRDGQPSPARLESLYAAASSGDLPLLKRLFKTAVENGEVEPFGLANHASTRTGFTALHAASSRGYCDIAVWLIEECGAMPDLEDREGETSLHKAALNGHMSIVQYLLPDKADVHASDADGWTALHNACSKGFLDIVRWLCENGGATTIVDGVHGVDIRSKDGWTPLMNAASKGHLPVVLYLLTKQAANPLVRNKWGETAFDIAAAVFEVWICEILQQAEAERWHNTHTIYNPLLVHTTVPVVLYENQRLDMRLRTVAVSGGRPKFSASGLGRQGRRAPFELRLPVANEDARLRILPAWRSGVQLPLKESPWIFPMPATSSQPALEGVERSHFWLSDWTLDITHPAVDAEEGWQYAHSFDDQDDSWTAEISPQLERLLTSNSIVSAGFGGSSHLGTLSYSSRRHPGWVRRRRWVRIMRRRLDIPPLPFLEPDGAMYHLNFDGTLVPYKDDNSDSRDEDEGQELTAMSFPSRSVAQDYVARARYLVGNQSQDSNASSSSISALEARRAILKLERAVSEIRQGLLGDEDADRKIQAEVLLNAYSRELDRRRLQAGIHGLNLTDDESSFEDDDDSSEEFRYPQSPIQERMRLSLNASGSTDHPQHVLADLTPHLIQAPDFRVPTHEIPQKVLSPRWTPPTPRQLHNQWERDDVVSQCRDCSRRFNFLVRRHVSETSFVVLQGIHGAKHCRKCGRIFCDRCSSYRTMLDPADVVLNPDPLLADVSLPTTLHRVCHTCYEEVSNNIPNSLHRANPIGRIVVDQERLTIPGSLTRRESSSQLSDLADCPVCNQNLDEVGEATAQENHVKNCLEGGSGTPQAAKYLVYRLPAESSLIGIECVICLEEFAKGSLIARLSCFCGFHYACLSSWLQRGKSCPVHAR